MKSLVPLNSVSFFCNVFLKKLGGFIMYSASFNLANLNWPKKYYIQTVVEVNAARGLSTDPLVGDPTKV